MATECAHGDDDDDDGGGVSLDSLDWIPVLNSSASMHSMMHSIDIKVGTRQTSRRCSLWQSSRSLESEIEVEHRP